MPITAYAVPIILDIDDDQYMCQVYHSHLSCNLPNINQVFINGADTSITAIPAVKVKPTPIDYLKY